MGKGTLIGESLRRGADIGGVVLQVTRIRRTEAGDVLAGQPGDWTMIDFEMDDHRAELLAATIQGALAPTGGWYCDFRTATETFVVFPDQVFRYRRGDTEARTVAESHGRVRGVPEAQLDWPE